MNDPTLILVWLALVCFVAAVFTALWRRDPAPWPQSIALIGAGLFFYVLYGLVRPH